MAERKPKPIVKVKNGMKLFKNYFHFVGMVSPVKKKVEGTENEYADQPFYTEKPTKVSQLPRRALAFQIQTAEKNQAFKVEINGMENKEVYLYSSKNNDTKTVAWVDRFDKTTHPEGYHLIDNPDWDKCLAYSQVVDKGVWVDVRGHYEFEEFENDKGEIVPITKRYIEKLSLVTNGQDIELSRDNFVRNYVTDFKSPDFKEINTINLQIGIRSTYQAESTGHTTINAVMLSYGKKKSKVSDFQLTVYKKEAAPVVEGAEAAKPTMSLADAFATLVEGDFIEIIGTDNNRIIMEQKIVEGVMESDDPFDNVEEKTKRLEWVITGDKKGLEVLSFVDKTKLLDFLSVEEMTKEDKDQAPQLEDPFANQEAPIADPFAQVETVTDNKPPVDPFAD